MKKFMFALTTLIIMTVSAKAMSYEQARQQALFLTDKMAYELNLTQEQYEAAYEVNLDYLMSVNSQSDLYGVYWRQRNLDLEYILLDWQYRLYLDATYFYRPLYWHAGYWHFGIYARYPRRDYFYFGRPHFYHVYRGGHSWRMNGGRSWYHGREFAHRNGNNRVDGMRDGFHRGEFGTGTRGTHTSGNTRSLNSSNGERSFGNGGTQLNRRNIENNGQSVNGVRGNSSTRSTVTQPNNNGSRTFGGNSPRNTFAPKSSTSSPQLRKVESPAQSIGTVTPNRTNTNTFGGNRGGSSSSMSRSSIGSTRSAGSISGARSGGSFGGARSGGSIGGTRSGGSFGGSRSSGGGSSSGSHSFGGRR